VDQKQGSLADFVTTWKRRMNTVAPLKGMAPLYSSSDQGGWTGGAWEVLITKEGDPELYALGVELFKDVEDHG
jgi:hypothetical protein